MFFFLWQLNKTSIIIDASKYIEELKQKVERLNEDLAAAQNPIDQNPLPMVLDSAFSQIFLLFFPFALISFLSYPLTESI